MIIQQDMAFVVTCPINPPLFCDIIDGLRVCMPVCQDGLFGDQSPTGNR